MDPSEFKQTLISKIDEVLQVTNALINDLEQRLQDSSLNASDKSVIRERLTVHKTDQDKLQNAREKLEGGDPVIEEEVKKIADMTSNNISDDDCAKLTEILDNWKLPFEAEIDVIRKIRNFCL